MFSFCRWQREIESRAGARSAFRPHSPSVPRDDPLHDGESDSSTREFRVQMQALEHAKQFFVIAHVEADPVVCYVVDRLPPVVFSAGFDCRRAFAAAELDRVGEQVYPYLLQKPSVSPRNRNGMQGEAYVWRVEFA